MASLTKLQGDLAEVRRRLAETASLQTDDDVTTRLAAVKERGALAVVEEDLLAQVAAKERVVFPLQRDVGTAARDLDTARGAASLISLAYPDPL